MPAFGFSGEAQKKAKKEEEGGLLNNVMSAADFLRPDKLLPAVTGAAIQQAKTIPTALAAPLFGGLEGGGLSEEELKRMDESPLSFLTDTGNLRRQGELFNRNEGAVGAADKFNAALGMFSPVAQNVQTGFAETGLRGGGLVGSALTQTGLVGPRISPNEATERYLNTESYGQAAQEGRAGGMLLGDLLNVAPALKGAGAATAANPLAGTAAGAKIAQAGAALERAPLAAYSAPAKKIYQGLERATLDATAFPKLAQIAEKEIPVVSKAAALPENLAQRVGDKWAGSVVRAEGLKQQGIINRSNDYAPAFDEMEANIERLAKEAPGPELEAALADYEGLRNQAKAEALTETKFEIARWADEQAKKLGVPVEKLHPTTALGRILDETAGDLAYQVEGLSSAREFPSAMGGISRKTAPAVEEAAFREAGFKPETGQIGQAGRALKQATKEAFPDVAASYKGKLTNPADVVPKVGRAIRNIPENFTNDFIESAMKGLDSPALPEGLGGKALKDYDTFMKAWKDQVLALRPAWHATNIIGNTMGAFLMGELSPTWFAQNVGRIMKEVEKPRELSGVAMGRGIGAEAIAETAGKAPRGGVLGRGYRKVTEKSYGINQKVDDFAHQAVALQKLDRLVEAGVPYQEALSQAESFSLKTMGDFGNMSAGERAVLRRISPFYPWYKHQAKATFRFPMENPARFAQAGATANRLTGGPQETPEGAGFLAGATPLGMGQFLRMGGGLGVGDPTQSPILNPDQALGSLAPPAQGLLALAGINPRGGELEAAPGQSKLSATAGYLMNQTATSKLAADLLDQARGEGGLVRSGTRAPIVSGGRPISDSKQGVGPIPAPLLSFLTGASLQEPNLRAAAQRERKKTKTEKTKEKNYQNAVKKKPKK